VEAETGPTSRCAIYDMNITKITAPMAAPMVRVTLIPFWWCSTDSATAGQGECPPDTTATALCFQRFGGTHFRRNSRKIRRMCPGDYEMVVQLANKPGRSIIGDCRTALRTPAREAGLTDAGSRVGCPLGALITLEFWTSVPERVACDVLGLAYLFGRAASG
jgi:hypothetical protein